MNKNSIILLAILLLSCLGIFSPTINIAFADEPDICKQLNLHFGECEGDQPLPDIPCCGEVTPLAWDHANSAEEISESGSVVTVTGGDDKIKWTIKGSGFYFDASHTLIEKETAGNSVTIYRTAEACAASITATDYCTKTNSVLIAPSGDWVTVPESEWPAPRAVPYEKMEIDRSGNDIYYAYYGEYLVRQLFAYVHNSHVSYGTENSFDICVSLDQWKNTVNTNTENPEYISAASVLDGVRVPNFDSDNQYTWTSCDDRKRCGLVVTRNSGLHPYKCGEKVIGARPNGPSITKRVCQ